MLTDEQLKMIQFAFVSHMTFSTYYCSTYKSMNTNPVIWVTNITPRDAYSPDELSDEELENRPKRKSRHFSCSGSKDYAHLETLNRNVPIKLI